MTGVSSRRVTSGRPGTSGDLMSFFAGSKRVLSGSKRCTNFGSTSVSSILLSPACGVPSGACTVVMVPHSCTTSSAFGNAPAAPVAKQAPATNQMMLGARRDMQRPCPRPEKLATLLSEPGRCGREILAQQRLPRLPLPAGLHLHQEVGLPAGMHGHGDAIA